MPPQKRAKASPVLTMPAAEGGGTEAAAAASEFFGLSMTPPPRPDKWGPTSRDTLTPMDAIEAAAAGAAGALVAGGSRPVVLYMSGNFCPIRRAAAGGCAISTRPPRPNRITMRPRAPRHAAVCRDSGRPCWPRLEHVRAIEMAKKMLAENSTAVLGAFVACIHDDISAPAYQVRIALPTSGPQPAGSLRVDRPRVQQTGRSKWFLPWECRIQLIEKAIGGHPFIRCDRWDGSQKTAQHPAAGHADLQQYLDAHAARSGGPPPKVLRVVGSNSSSLQSDAENVVCVKMPGNPSPLEPNAKLSQYCLSYDQAASMVSEMDSVPGMFGRADPRIRDVLHPAVMATLREWWPQKRTLPIDCSCAAWSALDPHALAQITCLEDFQRSDFSRSLFGGETAGLAAMLQLYYSAEDQAHFFQKALPKIVSAALELRNITRPLEMQSAGEISTTEISKPEVEAIVANMYLCVWPGAIEESADTTNPADFRLLWQSATPNSVQKLRLITHYLETVCVERFDDATLARKSQAHWSDGTAGIDKSMAVPTVRIQRRVLRRHADFAASSEAPLCRLSVIGGQRMAGTGLAASSQLARCNRFIGQGFLTPDSLASPDEMACSPAENATLEEDECFGTHPELLAAALLCPAMRRDEALVVTGTDAFAQTGSAGSLLTLMRPASQQRPAPNCAVECVTEKSLNAQLVCIDLTANSSEIDEPGAAAGGDEGAKGQAQQVDIQLRSMRRDLEKAYCGFWPSHLAVDDDGTCADATASDDLGRQFTRQFMADCTSELDAVLLLLAGSEARADQVQLHVKNDAGLSSSLQALAAAAGTEGLTVKWVWNKLVELCKHRLQDARNRWITVLLEEISAMPSVLVAGADEAEDEDTCSDMQLSTDDRGRLARGLFGGGGGGGGGGLSRSLFGGGGADDNTGGGGTSRSLFGADKDGGGGGGEGTSRSLFGDSDDDDDLSQSAGAGGGSSGGGISRSLF